MNEWLPEQLKTTSKLVEIAQLVILNEREDLLPTVLEFMFETVQQINDESCVVKNAMPEVPL